MHTATHTAAPTNVPLLSRRPLSADILQYYLACSPRAANPFQQVRAWAAPAPGSQGGAQAEAPHRPWPLSWGIHSPPGPLSGRSEVRRQLDKRLVDVTNCPSGYCPGAPMTPKSLGLLSFPGLPLASPAGQSQWVDVEEPRSTSQCGGPVPAGVSGQVWPRWVWRETLSPLPITPRGCLALRVLRTAGLLERCSTPNCLHPLGV